MHYLDCLEKKTHGTPDFPMEFYHIDKRHPRYEMPFHWHVECEIIQVLTGTLTLYLDDEELTVSPGESVFIESGVVHGGTPYNCIYECIVFQRDALLPRGALCSHELYPLSSHQVILKRHFGTDDQDFLKISRHLFRSMQKKTSGSELTALGILYELYGIVLQKQLYVLAEPSTKRTPKKLDLLKCILEYIELHYGENISLDELSGIADMSPKYFCRFFHAMAHRSPIDYLNYYRIERACCLLENDSVSITEIAYDCGFSDTSYFIRTFKKYKGLTPKQYRLRLT